MTLAFGTAASSGVATAGFITPVLDTPLCLPLPSFTTLAFGTAASRGVAAAGFVCPSFRHTLVFVFALAQDPGIRNCRMQFNSPHSGHLRRIVLLILLMPPWHSCGLGRLVVRELKYLAQKLGRYDIYTHTCYTYSSPLSFPSLSFSLYNAVHLIGEKIGWEPIW